MKRRVLSLILGVFLAAAPLMCLCVGSASAAPSISSAAAIVVDCQTGEIYFQKDIDTAQPVASMTKLMALYLVFEEIDAGRLSLNSKVTASAYAADVSNNKEYSGMEKLKEGGSYRVDTLLRLIMTASCNGSMIALAEHVGGTEAKFVQRMNEKAAAWGVSARFADCTGLESEGNAVTARAMAYIARRLVLDYPKILEYSSLESFVFDSRIFRSTNDLLRSGTVAGLDGLKTGTTSEAGCCFTSTAMRDGRRIIAVVMGAPDGTVRMSESETLLEYGFTCRAEREKSWAANGVTVELSVEQVVYPTTQTVTIDGVEREFQMYSIKDAKGNDTNYIKIRDLALALKGTKAQFDVGMANGVITFIGGGNYTPNGTENSTPYSGVQSYTKKSGNINVDGTLYPIDAFEITYNGGGYTYFQMKDIARKLNFNAAWRGTIVIETDQPYTGK